MGCQCAKSEDTSQLNLDKSPQKQISEEEQNKSNILSINPSKTKLESADLSKISNSKINESKTRKKISKKKSNKII